MVGVSAPASNAKQSTPVTPNNENDGAFAKLVGKANEEATSGKASKQATKAQDVNSNAKTDQKQLNQVSLDASQSTGLDVEDPDVETPELSATETADGSDESQTQEILDTTQLGQFQVSEQDPTDGELNSVAPFATAHSPSLLEPGVRNTNSELTVQFDEARKASSLAQAQSGNSRQENTSLSVAQTEEADLSPAEQAVDLEVPDATIDATDEQSARDNRIRNFNILLQNQQITQQQTPTERPAQLKAFSVQQAQLDGQKSEPGVDVSDVEVDGETAIDPDLQQANQQEASADTGDTRPKPSSPALANTQMQVNAEASKAAAAQPKLQSEVTTSVAAELSSEPITSEAPTTNKSPAGQAQSAQILRHASPVIQQAWTGLMQRIDGQSQRFEIRLDPAELGKIDVSIEIDSDNQARIVMAARNAEALNELTRGSRALEDALAESGVDLKEDGLTFELSDDGSASFTFLSDDDNKSDGQSSDTAQNAADNPTSNEQTEPSGLSPLLSQWSRMRVDIKA